MYIYTFVFHKRIIRISKDHLVWPRPKTSLPKMCVVRWFFLLRFTVRSRRDDDDATRIIGINNVQNVLNYTITCVLSKARARTLGVRINYTLVAGLFNAKMFNAVLDFFFLSENKLFRSRIVFD